MLTDVLLTVTNEEIKAIARETLAARKGSSLFQLYCARLKSVCQRH